MNDLDRRIAELKGLTVDGLGGLSTDKPGIFTLGPTWSHSDTKALELVDDLRDWNFDLFRGVRGYTKWIAMFEYRAEELVLTSQQFDFPFYGEAPTRPEAICRAYIAAVTWLQERKS